MNTTRLRELGAAVSFHIRDIAIALALIAGGAAADDQHALFRTVGVVVLGAGFGLFGAIVIRVLMWSSEADSSWADDFRVGVLCEELARIGRTKGGGSRDVLLIDRGRRVGIVRVLPDVAPDKAECAFEMLAAAVDDGFTALNDEHERVAGVIYRGKHAVVVRGLLNSLPGVVEQLTRPAAARREGGEA